ncbi:MAG: ATP-dependent helicase [Candidatus Eremiobacteraeota bacterium]|nr:ATP-dependent helicase [Candidatus Eremiobacteraeota bacterium]MBC5828471.1 ATP-dependent helicase [Candidatus Eremiobacteraeota bacterium]
MLSSFAPTPEQLRVIEHRGSHVLVFAGPGTGKTETLARRFASIVVDDGVSPSDILVLTFSRRAADAMRDRILQRLRERRSEGLGAPELFVKTFHSFCARLLDGDGGRYSQRQLLTPVKERALWQRVLADVKLSTIGPEVAHSAAFAVDALNAIAQLKGQGVSAQTLAAAAPHGRLADLAALYAGMERQRTALGLSDFRDLVSDAVGALEDPASAGSRWLAARGPFEHILVDEFQDSDGMQLRLLEILAGSHPRTRPPAPQLCFVGDINQSIYRFRGASPHNIETAQRRFDCSDLDLTLNRRSAQAILDVANETPLLSKNSLTKAEDTVIEGSVRLVKATMTDDEIEYICKAVQERRQKAPGDSIAVLLRSNAPYQSLIAQALETHGILVAARPTDNFHDDSLIDAVLRALALLLQQDDERLKRALMTNPVVGFNPLSVRAKAPRGRMSLRDYDAAWDRIARAHASLDECAHVVRAVARELDLLEPIRTGRVVPGFDPLASPARLSALLQAAEDITSVRRALGEPPVTIAVFLERIDEIVSLIADPTQTSGPQTDGVAVMSIHAAKGLEFDFVVIPQCVEGVLPMRSRPNVWEELIAQRLPEVQRPDDSLREEASLWYVALTRARRDVLATAARVDDDGVDTVTSRFCQAIGEVDDAAPSERWSEAPTARLSDPAEAPEPRRPIVRQLLTLSPTDVNTFLVCPREYFYARVLGVGARQTDAMRLGKVVHTALQRFHEAERDFSAVSASVATIGRYASALHELALEAVRESAAEIGLAEDSGMFRYETARLQRQLGHYARALAHEAMERPFQVLHCEQRITSDLGGVRVSGRVDRIDRLSSGGIAIRDYKGGKFKTKPSAETVRTLLDARSAGSALFGDSERGVSLQTILYVPGVEELTGEKVRLLDYVYLAGEKKGSETGDDFPTAIDRIDLTEEPTATASPETSLARIEINAVLSQVAAEMVRRLAGGEMTAFPTTEDPDNCKYCGFTKVCTGIGTVLA